MIDYETELLKRLVVVQEAMDFCVSKIIKLEERIDQQDDVIKGITEFVSGWDKIKKKILSKY